MTLTRREFADRIRELAGHLGELKHRVRRAVATETGKAVADAVKDLLTAALGGTVDRNAYHSPSAYRPAQRDWERNGESSRDRWDDDEDEPYDGRSYRTEDRHSASRVVPPPPRWPAVLMLTTAAVKGWANRRLPTWAAATVGVAAAAAAVIGGPVLHAGLALAGAAIDLLPHAFPTHPPT